MKKVLILFGKSDWEKAKPFANKDYQYSYEFFYTLCKQNGIQMYRASYEWYDYENHFFKHAWIYDGPGGNWSRTDNVSPDIIYDKTKGRTEVYYKKELIGENFPIINDLTFTRIIDDKFLTGLIFAEWSKENHVVRNPEELSLHIGKISTPLAVLKPICDSGGNGVQVFEKTATSKISFHGEHILQEFIDSSRGVPGVKTGLHDLRLVFVNDSLIYSYIRSPQPHSYLANLAQGGSLLIVPAEKLPDSLTPIIEHSRKTFSSFNPKIYTIDVMFDETERPWVVELNSMPGLYFTPEEKPSMERLYAELLTVFQNKLGQYPSPDTLFSAVPATRPSLQDTPASTMKITVICKNTEWQVQKLCEAAAELGCDIDVKDISTPGILPADLGDIVIWRSSSLGCGPERLEMMRLIMMKRTLINRCLAQLPRATEKVFQQEYVSQKTKWVRCIPTFVFRSVDERTTAIKSGLLRYPFIQKPNNGSKGKGVELINNEGELGQFTQDIHRQVYQNFIKNSGDYRAFILGGRLIGAIKRTPAKGEFLNNISRGGHAEVVTDPKILSELRRIGTVVASIFELSLCGVDIIFDEKTRTYFFLEVNTVPQWKGFQEATGIDVGREIIQYGQRLIKRRESSSLPELISKEYLSQMRFLGEKKFHFLSRIFLWSNDPSLMKNLNELQKEYIGISQSDHRKILEKISTRKTLLETRMIAKEKRQVFFEKYPDLEPFLNLLFKNLFSREIYGVDLRPHIRKIVSETELIKLKNALENDPQAMQVLSTHAINYLYLVDDYLQTPASQVNPEKYFQIGISSTGESLKLRLYFFTHCIIGASKFYSTKIRQADLAIYTKMLRAAESIIKDDFQKISLDNKFEFLVCAKICGYVSEIEELILSEAGRSLAPDGNFLIDTENETATPDGGNDFVGAEHRNVLYIMSQTPFRPHDTNSP